MVLPLVVGVGVVAYGGPTLRRDGALVQRLVVIP